MTVMLPPANLVSSLTLTKPTYILATYLTKREVVWSHFFTKISLKEWENNIYEGCLGEKRFRMTGKILERGCNPLLNEI